MVVVRVDQILQIIKHKQCFDLSLQESQSCSLMVVVRAMMLKEGGVQSECVVLEPLTISIAMQRNLSAAWYHDSPDIQLGGALEPLTVSAGLIVM